MSEESELSIEDTERDIEDELADSLAEEYIQQRYPESISLPQPGGHEKCWRYIDFTQYISILEKEQLYFANPSQFNDQFEGSLPKANIQLRREWAKSGKVSSEINEKISEMIEQVSPEESDLDLDFEDSIKRYVVDYAFELVNKTINDFILINCWHNKERESAAMWNQYTNSGAGLVIKTTYSDLLQSLVSYDNLHQPIGDTGNISKMFAGEVRYIDYETDEIPETFLHPYFYKRQSFSNEDELRLIYIDSDEKEDGEYDKYFDVDVENLIHEVRLAPESPEWFVDLTESVTEKFGFDIPVKRSELEREPVF